MESTQGTKIVFAIYLIFLSIGSCLVGIRMLKNLPSKSTNRIFNIQNAQILKLRILMVVAVFLIFAIWLLWSAW